MSYACVMGASVRGCEVLPVCVIASVETGMPQFRIEGLADASVLNMRGTIRSAIRASGFEVPRATVTLGFTPAVRQRVSSRGLELAAALAILVADGQAAQPEGAIFYGDLSVSGGVVDPGCGVAEAARLAHSFGAKLVSSPVVGEPCEGVLGAPTLAHAATGHTCPAMSSTSDSTCPSLLDFSVIKGFGAAKRALAVAAGAGLGALLVGPHSTPLGGLARCVPGILPPLGSEEAEERERIESIVRGAPFEKAANGRPLATVGERDALAAIIGGGRPVRPGAITLAHAGVLHIDGAERVQPHVMQALGMPVEDGAVSIVRADGLYRMPARAIPIGTAEACPCGGFGDPDATCRCSTEAIERHRACLLAGVPLVFKMVVSVSPDDGADVTTEELRDIVETSRGMREERVGEPRETTEASAEIERSGADARTLRVVAGALADAEGGAEIERRHVLEALCYVPR